MKANRRMNLFRGITEQKAQAFQMPKIKLGIQGGACVVVIVAFSFLTYSKVRKFNIDMAAMEKRRTEIENEVNKLVQDAAVVANEEVQAKLAAAKLKKEEKEQAIVREISQLTSEIDGSWTSVLWKLTTHASDILMTRVELGAKDPKATQGAVVKMVVIDGKAASLPALTRWIEYLNVHLPKGAFSVDRHAQIPDKKFPVSFRISARVGL